MRNLAGVELLEVDHVVRFELDQAGIPAVAVARSTGEVAAAVEGRLGEYTLTRAWRYWVIKGLVPLSVAEELYRDPVGRRDVRVGGHGGCPAPRAYGTVWLAPCGKRVLSREEEAECHRYAEMGDNQTVMAAIGRKLLAENLFSNDPPNYLGVRGYVDGYHIDSEAGLALFANAVRIHGLLETTGAIGQNP